MHLYDVNCQIKSPMSQRSVIFVWLYFKGIFFKRLTVTHSVREYLMLTFACTSDKMSGKNITVTQETCIVISLLKCIITILLDNPRK